MIEAMFVLQPADEESGSDEAVVISWSIGDGSQVGDANVIVLSGETAFGLSYDELAASAPGLLEIGDDARGTIRTEEDGQD